MHLSTTNPRRRFLTQLAAGAGALSTVPGGPLHADAVAAQGAPDAWVAQVKGTHRCLFDFPAHKFGTPLLHINNYIATYQAAYKQGPDQVGAVGTLYGVGGGSSIIMGFDDAIWKKYGLGEYAGLRDAKGAAYTTNVFNSPTEADGHLLAKAMDIPPLPMFGGAAVASSVASLQKRNVTFLMCNNALMAWTFELAARGKGEQAAIDTELRAHLLPGVIIVPAMVVAIEQAQAAGMRYNRQ